MPLPNFKLTERDFYNAKKLMEKERVQPPITEEKMFAAAIDCMLAVSEKEEKRKKVFADLSKVDLLSPEEIIKRPYDLKEVLKPTRFPKRKFEYIRKFAEWWKNSEFPEDVLKDIANGREREFELRNRFAEEAPGIGHKTASFCMIKYGYEKVVPIDLWMLRYLKSLGYDVEIPDYERKSGPKREEYLFYEKIASEEASRYRVSPALFQFAVWQGMRKSL